MGLSVFSKLLESRHMCKQVGFKPNKAWLTCLRFTFSTPPPLPLRSWLKPSYNIIQYIKSSSTLMAWGLNLQPVCSRSQRSSASHHCSEALDKMCFCSVLFVWIQKSTVKSSENDIIYSITVFKFIFIYFSQQNPKWQSEYSTFFLKHVFSFSFFITQNKRTLSAIRQRTLTVRCSLYLFTVHVLYTQKDCTSSLLHFQSPPTTNIMDRAKWMS